MFPQCVRATVGNMFTTAEASEQTGLSQRVIQKRLARLGLTVKYAGPVALLTASQIKKIAADKRKPGPKNGKPKGKRIA